MLAMHHGVAYGNIFEIQNAFEHAFLLDFFLISTGRMHFKIPLIDPFRWDEDVAAEEERTRQWNGLRNGDFRQQATGIFRYKIYVST